MDKVFIATDFTALELHRRHRETEGGIFLPARFAESSRLALPAPSSPEWGNAAASLGLLGCQPPYSVLVMDRNDRRDNESVRTRYVKRLPDGMPLCPIGGNLFACPPEFCLMQLAKYLDEVQLLGLAFEMCGFYTRDECGKDFPRKLEPICTPGSIKRSLQEYRGFHGAKRLRTIADEVLANSRSVKETQMALQTCLPERLRGFSLPHPLMNYIIEVPFAESEMLGARSYTVDLCWPEHRLALEYDSEAFHGEARRKADARRRNGIRYLGYTLVEANAANLATTFAAARMAQSLSTLMGIQGKPGQFDVTAEKVRAHNQIMDLSRYP